MLTVSSIVARLARLNVRAEEFAAEAARQQQAAADTLLNLREHRIYVDAMQEAAAKLWDARAVLEKALERIARDEDVMRMRQHEGKGG